MNKQRTRGFELIHKYLDQPIRLPRRQTPASAAYDFEVIYEATILPGQTLILETGVKAYMLPDEVLVLAIRSSKGIKESLVLANSVAYIDADYYNNEDNEGHILLAIRNLGQSPKLIRKGERIAQGMFIKYLLVDDDQPVNKPRTGGLGHTKSF